MHEDQQPNSLTRWSKQVRLVSLVWVCGCLGLAFGGGYLVGAVRQNPSTSLSVRQLVPLEMYVLEESFSEIANTKAKLRALSVEFLNEVHARHDATVAGAGHGVISRNPLYSIEPERAVEELRKGIEEFKGTEEELTLVRELLWLLKRQRLETAWIDLYLETLYAHPTWSIVGQDAREAVDISKRLGRQKELTDALDLLRRFPIGSATRDLITADVNMANVTKIRGPIEIWGAREQEAGNNLPGLPPALGP